MIKMTTRPLALIVAIPLAALIVGLAGVLFILSGSVSSSADTPPDISPNLTGSNAAEALGLKATPIQGEHNTCVLGAIEPQGDNYCLDGLTSDPVEGLLFAQQIAGKPTTELRRQFFAEYVELQQMVANDAADDVLTEQQLLVGDLFSKVSAEDADRK